MPSLSREDQHACIADFDQLVGPLGLAGPNREFFHAAFLEAPDRFAELVDDALRRARKNPAGLLYRMVRDGDHRRASATLADAPKRVSKLQQARAWIQAAGWQYEDHDLVEELGRRGFEGARRRELLDLAYVVRERVAGAG